MDISFTEYQICNQGNTIAAAIAAHFAVSRKKNDRFNDELGLFLYLHDTTDTRSITDDILTSSGFVIENGYLHSPTGPGLGVELDEKMVTRYASDAFRPIRVE